MRTSSKLMPTLRVDTYARSLYLLAHTDCGRPGGRVRGLEVIVSEFSAVTAGGVKPSPEWRVLLTE